MAQQGSQRILYRIGNIGTVHNSGMVATRAISGGQLIHKESPLVLVNTGVSWSTWLSNPTSFWQAEQRGPSRVAQALAALNPHDQADYRALHAVGRNQTPLRQGLDIAEHNSYSFPYSTARNKRAWLTILRDMSRVNHSCLPNAIMSGPCTETGNLGTVKLVATRDIAANEEILLEYESGDNFWLQPAAVRRPELHKEWHFQCGCPACDPKSSPFYDSTWEYIKMLRNEVATTTPIAPHLLRARVNHLNILVDLLLAYGFADGRLSDAYRRLADAHMILGNYREANRVALAGYECESHFWQPGPGALMLARVFIESHRKLNP